MNTDKVIELERSRKRRKGSVDTLEGLELPTRVLRGLLK